MSFKPFPSFLSIYSNAHFTLPLDTYLKLLIYDSLPVKNQLPEGCLHHDLFVVGVVQHFSV